MDRAEQRVLRGHQTKGRRWITEKGAVTEWGESEGVPQSPAQRREQGRALRKTVPRSGHAGWVPGADRTDPVALLEGQNEGRVPWLVPIRRGRMMVSPFTFYRGAARIMVHDLATTPSSGLNVQVCGDGHLSNFGVYGSPERQLVFDINDFDETLPGPWEWDVKRLAASFVIAGRHRGFGEEDNRTIAARSVTSYRETMLELAEKPTLDVWYAHLSTERLATLVEESGKKRTAKRIGRLAEKARRKDGLQAFRKLAEKSGGSYRIRSDHPVLVPIRDVERYYGFEHFKDVDEFTAELHRSFEDYRSTLRSDRQLLLSPLSAGGHRSQGCRGRERGHSMLHLATRRQGRGGPALPTGETGDAVGARRASSRQPLAEQR